MVCWQQLGLTIFVKQFNVALGVKSSSGSILDAIFVLPETIMELNPVITFIAVVSLFILIIHPRFQNNLFKKHPISTSGFNSCNSTGFCL